MKKETAKQEFFDVDEFSKTYYSQGSIPQKSDKYLRSFKKPDTSYSGRDSRVKHSTAHMR